MGSSGNVDLVPIPLDCGEDRMSSWISARSETSKKPLQTWSMSPFSVVGSSAPYIDQGRFHCEHGSKRDNSLNARNLFLANAKLQYDLSKLFAQLLQRFVWND